MKYILILTGLLITFASCNKKDCQTCTQTIGGFTGNITKEIREVCNKNEALKLEQSSSGTTVWTCE